MGLRVEIDEKSEALLRKMKSSPSEIFQNGYSAYMIMLAGAAHQPALDWLSENAAALDAITSDKIAFVVFASSVSIRMDIPYDEYYAKKAPPVNREPTRIGKVKLAAASNPAKISWLVRRGKLGHVITGDELVAVTRATFSVARQFDASEHLPCVVVIDAIPADGYEIIKLTPSVRASFVQALGRAMSKYVSSKNHEMSQNLISEFIEYKECVSRVETHAESLLAESEAAETELRNAKTELQGLRRKRDYHAKLRAREIQHRLDRAKQLLLQGELGEFRKAMLGNQGAAEYGFDSIAAKSAIISAAEKLEATFLSLHDSVARLAIFHKEVRWPLNKQSKAQLEQIHIEIQEAIPQPGRVPKLQKRECVQYFEAIRAKQSALVEQVFAGMPSLRTLSLNVVDNEIRSFSERAAILEKKWLHVRGELESLPLRQPEIDRELSILGEKIERTICDFKEARVSFAKVFKSEARLLGLINVGATVKSKLKNYADSSLISGLFSRFIDKLF